MNAHQHITNFADTLRSSIDALKGLLIVIVVMDHNDLFRTLAPDVFMPLTFHVLGFLVLPFFLPIKPVDGKFFRDRLIRYLVPFWWVLTLSAVLYAVMFRGGSGLGTILIDWLAAVAIGSATLVKTTSGFFYLWFLPSLAGLVLLLTLYQSIQRRWRYVAVAVMLCCHALITFFPTGMLTYLPFGLLIVAWVFPLGLLLRWAMTNTAAFRLRYVILAIFLGSYSYLVAHRINLEIMLLDLRSITDPLLFLLQDINAVSGVLVTMWLATKLDQSRLLNLCGKHSLMVYLLHPLIFFLGYKVSGAANWHLDFFPLFAASVLSVVLTVLISLAMAMAIARMPIARAWLTPKDWNDWAPVRLISHRFV